MSDGLSDANALGRLGNELEEAAYSLLDAIRTVEEGHRGLTVNIELVVNDVLRNTEYRLRRR